VTLFQRDMVVEEMRGRMLEAGGWRLELTLL
jgi:hypothetical protein